VRIQKIRGYHRKIQQIENWRNESLELRFDLLMKNNYAYADIVVHPWCDISIINSVFPEPKGKARIQIINGLIDIYESWKKELDKLGKPYYLKIWLFEQRLSKSQVVCAINEKIDYYENLFYHPERGIKSFNPIHFSKLSENLARFLWEYKLDEDKFDNNFIGESEMYASIEEYNDAKRWFDKLLKKPHRLIKREQIDNEFTELYAFKRGDLWLGEIRN